MPDLKISQFNNGGAVQPTDEIATNRGGTNTKVFVGTAAAADLGSGPDDISTNSTISINVTNTLQGTSTTSNSIGTGSKSFTTDQHRSFYAGRYLLITSDSNPTTLRMSGIVTDYVPTTGELTVTIINSTGSGTYTDWTIRVSGDDGADGTNGTNGTNGTDGTDGWSPVLSIATDGERRVFQLVDWVGGEGAKPATGDYIGSTGLVPDIGDGVDIRGATGAGGVSSVNTIEPDGSGNVSLSAEDIPYDNATTGIAAANVQALVDNSIAVDNKGTVTSGTVTFNLATHRSFTITQNGAITYAVSNAFLVNNEDIFTVLLTWTSGNRNWFSNIDWANDKPLDPQAGKKYEIVFKTVDGGTRWSGFWQQVGA